MSLFSQKDSKLPRLKQAVDDELMQRVLTSALGNGVNGADYRVRHEILKHKPGKHCVLLYLLESRDTPSARRVVGKMYRMDRGKKIFQNMLSLWSANHNRDRCGAVLGMAEPLAYVPELGMVIQRAVFGRLFARLSAWNELADAVRCVARNLAVLHSLPGSTLERRTTMEAHIKKFCRPGPRSLAAECLEMAPLVEELVGGLQANKSLLSAPLCPVHGDLGLSQIYINDNQAAFVDFDGCCLSHPALDLSNFLIALKVHYGPPSDDLRRLFLAAYLENHSPAMLVGLPAYHALIYLRRAMICFRTKSAPRWRQQVRQFLEIGIGLLK
ncbi:MAG TPA: phosphotransferase [bacterium]